jgi:capsular polysaccharide transport system permease protein
MLWVALPTLLGALYYGLIAAKQYESVATVVINSETDKPQVAATLMREHLISRDMQRVLEKREHMGAHYQQGGDFISRLSPHARSETRYSFFRDHVDVRYDAQTRVLSLTVRAFSGEAARRFARLMLEDSQEFVMATTHSKTPPFFVVAKPSAPDEATYPRRGYAIVTVFFASLALFAIGSLLIAAVREHAQF